MEPTMTLLHSRAVGPVAVAALLMAGAGSLGNNADNASGTTAPNAFGDPGECNVIVDMAVSPEKSDLINALATDFNSRHEKVNGKCIFIRPQSKASGGAATLLATDWDTATDGPRPVIWSPAASSWGAVLNQRLSDSGKAAMAPTNSQSFMLTPLTIAMPKPMADALGYPGKPVGWADVAKLATDPAGWSAYGHPEWGEFRLGKTNPNYSTSGL